MRSRRLTIGLSALAALAFVAGSATAGDTVRLSLPGGASASTLNLKATPNDLAADNVATRFGHGFIGHRGYYGGGFYGGYRGFYGGGFRGYYGGYYGGYRGYVGYRGYAGYGLGYGGYAGYGGYGGYGCYAPSFSYTYAAPSSYASPYYSGYVSGGYYAPIVNSGVIVRAQTTELRPAASPSIERPLPMPEADDRPRTSPGQPGTFPYDGGPQRRVPVPAAEEVPVVHPRLDKPAIVEDLVVKSTGKSSGKWTYPAYGEKPSR